MRSNKISHLSFIFFQLNIISMERPTNRRRDILG